MAAFYGAPQVYLVEHLGTLYWMNATKHLIDEVGLGMHILDCLSLCEIIECRYLHALQLLIING